jgi:hypothetical protein
LSHYVALKYADTIPLVVENAADAEAGNAPVTDDCS